MGYDVFWKHPALTISGYEFVSPNEAICKGDITESDATLPCIKITFTAPFKFETIEPAETYESWQLRLAIMR